MCDPRCFPGCEAPGCGPYMPNGICSPIDPCCSPCGPCGPCYSECGPQKYSSMDLCKLPQCPGMVPPQRSGPRYITLQAPPKLVSRKDVVYCDRTVIDKHLVPQTRAIYDAKVVDSRKTLYYPCVTYKKYTIPEPRVIWERKEVPDPQVMCCPREVCEPREVCTPMVCKPKPQCIPVPPPMDYICAPSGSPYMRSNPCPPWSPSC